MRWVSSNYKRVDTAVFQNFYGIVAQDSLRSTLAPANFVEVTGARVFLFPQNRTGCYSFIRNGDNE